MSGSRKVPIVPAAVIFDLDSGSAETYPDGAAGYAACLAASPDEGREGNVGAGTGAQRRPNAWSYRTHQGRHRPGEYRTR